MTQDRLKQKITKAVESDPHQDAIKSISIFGSYLHGNHRSSSDLDLLLELDKNVGLFTLAAIQLHLEKELGLPVDLVEKESLSKYLKSKVIKEAQKVYER